MVEVWGQPYSNTDHPADREDHGLARPRSIYDSLSQPGHGQPPMVQHEGVLRRRVSEGQDKCYSADGDGGIEQHVVLKCQWPAQV